MSSLTATVHLAAGLAALSAGALALATRKGSRGHRWAGRGYLAAMLLVNLSAFGLYGLTGSFNGLHLLAAISLVSVAIGGWAARAHWPGEQAWARTHAFCMAFSYLGLWSAAVSQLALRLLPLPPGLAVPLAVGVVMALGSVLVVVAVPRALPRPL